MQFRNVRPIWHIIGAQTEQKGTIMLNKEQKQKRKGGLGASDIPSILGLGFRTAREVALEKRRPVSEDEDLDDNPAIERGNFLEAGVRAWTAKRIGCEIIDSPTVYVPDTVLFARPDGLAPGRGYYEGKCPGRWTAQDWRDPNEDPAGVPVYVSAQIQYQCGVAREDPSAPDLDRIYVGAFYSDENHVYEVPYNPEVYSEIKAAALAWWDRYGAHAKELPPIDYEHPRAIEAIRESYPAHVGDTLAQIMPEDPISQVVADFKRVSSELAASKKQQDAIKAEIMEYLGDLPGLEMPDGSRIWYKQTKPRSHFDKKELEKKYPEIYKELTKTKPGSRVFRPTWKTKGE